ncbi:unnamed protein product [Dracunculus medinensis]|uniref:Uncharacterized protein n=1 Tax=Dracunculus medinensis TaxID=318479 RepID=A0A0N4U4Z8_DRAME|nr:unnamed protein product [Dracunculus medinensis]
MRKAYANYFLIKFLFVVIRFVSEPRRLKYNKNSNVSICEQPVLSQEVAVELERIAIDVLNLPARSSVRNPCAIVRALTRRIADLEAMVEARFNDGSLSPGYLITMWY